MPVISVRIPDETIVVFKDRGLRPGALAKEFLMGRARELELEGRMERLAAVRKASDRPIVDELRDIRDHD